MTAAFFLHPKEYLVIQRQLKVMIATFPYGGNGATASEVPDIRHWETRNVLWMAQDKRIQPFDDWLPGRDYIKISDTPISMCRNQAVMEARQAGADVLIMVDSDMRPDCEFGQDPLAKPFVPTAFEFLYNHWEKGPVVLAAPYCGSSPVNNVFAFHWDTDRNPRADVLRPKLSQYSRNQAYQMDGIQPVGAIGTGLMMFDMRIFNLLPPPWFYYTYDAAEAKKLATEDCTFTRDVSMIGHLKLGYETLLCCWSSWAGHWKPELIRKPQPMTTEQVSGKFRQAALDDIQPDERFRDEQGTYVIEHNVRLPDAEDGQTGSTEWKILGVADGAVQVAGDAIDPKAKEEYLQKHGLAFVAARAGQDWDTHETPTEDLQALAKLVKRLKRKLKRKPRVLELGSWTGNTARAMIAAGAQVTCIDHFRGNRDDSLRITALEVGPAAVKARFLANMQGLAKSYELLEGDCLKVAKKLKDGAYDMVFFDAEHSAKPLAAQIETYLPKLRPGAIVSGHDFKVFAGVEEAVRLKFGQDFEVINCVWHTTKRAVAKPAQPAKRAAARNRRRKTLRQVSAVAAVHQKVLRHHDHAVSRVPAGRSLRAAKRRVGKGKAGQTPRAHQGVRNGRKKPGK